MKGGIASASRRERASRFYSADLGRFLSPDSIVPGAANPQALNRYSYVLNNPATYSDPSGHCIPEINCPAGLGGGTKPPSLAAMENSVDPYTMALLEAMLELEEFKRGRLGFIEGLLKEGSSLLPGLGESEDIANIVGCSWVEERCGLPLWRRGLGGAAFFIPIVGGSFLAHRGDDAADLLRANRARGLAAETILGAPGVKKALRTGSGSNTFPDMFDRRLKAIAEVKNVKYLSNSAQLRTYAEFARQQGWTFALVVRHDTTLSGPLQTAVDKGQIELFRVGGLP